MSYYPASRSGPTVGHPAYQNPAFLYSDIKSATPGAFRTPITQPNASSVAHMKAIIKMQESKARLANKSPEIANLPKYTPIQWPIV